MAFTNKISLLDFDCRRDLFGLGCVILLLRCLFMMNTAMIFLTCVKDPAILGSNFCIYASLTPKDIYNT